MVTLTTLDVAALGERGFVVLEDAVPVALTARARLEVQALAAQGALARAGVRRGGDRSLDDSIRSDFTGWVDEQTGGALGEVRGVFEALREQLNREAFLGLRRFELQVGWYPPGAHYAKHRDAFPGDDNRRVTAIVYLNEGWVPAHGGLLRLHLDPAIDVEPSAGRMVVFLSERIEHEVLTASAERAALTAWFSR